MGVKLEVDDKYHNKLVRQGDQSILDVTTEKGYRDKNLESINGLRKYLNLIHLSDLVKCDGRTFSEYLLGVSGWAATNMTFPKEQMIRNDKSLLRQILDSWTDVCNTLLKPPAEYVSPPHTKLYWQYDQASASLQCSNFDNTEE